MSLKSKSICQLSDYLLLELKGVAATVLCASELYFITVIKTSFEPFRPPSGRLVLTLFCEMTVYMMNLLLLVLVEISLLSFVGTKPSS